MRRTENAVAAEDLPQLMQLGCLNCGQEMRVAMRGSPECAGRDARVVRMRMDDDAQVADAQVARMAGRPNAQANCPRQNAVPK